MEVGIYWNKYKKKFRFHVRYLFKIEMDAKEGKSLIDEDKEKIANEGEKGWESEEKEKLSNKYCSSAHL